MGERHMNDELFNEYYPYMVQEMFLGYKERKRTGRLYQNPEHPKMLIVCYFRQKKEDIRLYEFKTNFKNNYIEGECLLERSHTKEEVAGLGEMYEYIYSDEIDKNFDIYTLMELHQKLFSKAPYPEIGGQIRNSTATIEGTKIDCTPPEYIRLELKYLEDELNEIIELGKKINEGDYDLFKYIDKCIMLKCKLIKIHPFFDGNGRSVRAFMNKLFTNVGLPPMYINEHEHIEYKQAMQLAIGEEEDYEKIINFYYYKICDSIIELDINPRIYSEEPNYLKIINEVVNNVYKEVSQLEIENLYKEKLDELMCMYLKNALYEKGVESRIEFTTQYNENIEKHAFLVVYYKKFGEYKRLLVDPTFQKIQLDSFNSPRDLEKPSREIAHDLARQGLTDYTLPDPSKYIAIFKEKEMSFEKPIVGIVPVEHYDKQKVLTKNMKH